MSKEKKESSKTKDTDNKKKKISKKSETTETLVKPPAEHPIQQTSATVVATTDTSVSSTGSVRGRKAVKNADFENIVASDLSSFSRWERDFNDHCLNNPPTRGYDQHYNRMGFVDAGPVSRLTNQGCVRMATLLISLLAKRSNNKDAEASALLDSLVEFSKNRRETLEIEAKEIELEKATSLLKAAGRQII